MAKVWLYGCALAAISSCAQFAAATGINHFEVTGPTPSSYFNFDIADTPRPSATTTASFTVDNVVTNAFNTQIGFYSFQADYTFYLSDTNIFDGGSFSSTARGRFYGDELFSGRQAHQHSMLETSPRIARLVTSIIHLMMSALPT